MGQGAQKRATNKNNAPVKEKNRDSEQHRGMEKEREVSGALQRDGGSREGKGQGAAERGRERRDGQEEGQGQRDTE